MHGVRERERSGKESNHAGDAGVNVKGKRENYWR